MYKATIVRRNGTPTFNIPSKNHEINWQVVGFISGKNLKPSFEVSGGLLFSFGVSAIDEHDFIKISKCPVAISARFFAVGGEVLSSRTIHIFRFSIFVSLIGVAPLMGFILLHFFLMKSFFFKKKFRGLQKKALHAPMLINRASAGFLDFILVQEYFFLNAVPTTNP